MSAQNPQNLADLLALKKAIATVAPFLTSNVGADVESGFQAAIDNANSLTDGRIDEIIPDTPGSVPTPILADGTLYVGFVDASGKRTYAELPAAIDAATIPIPAASGGGATPPDGSGGDQTPPATVTIPVLPPGQTTPPDSGTTTPPADTGTAPATNPDGSPAIPPATNPDGSPVVDPNAPPVTNPDGSPVLPPPVPVPNP